MKPEELYWFPRACEQVPYNQRAMIALYSSRRRLHSQFHVLNVWRFSRCKYQLLFSLSHDRQNGFHLADFLKRYNALSISTAQCKPLEITCVHHNCSGVTLAGWFLTAYSSHGRQKGRSNSYNKVALFLNEKIKSKVGPIINHMKKMGMLFSLSFREVVHFPSHLHIDIQGDVSLRTYIFPILLTNGFMVVNTEAHVASQNTNSMQ